MNLVCDEGVERQVVQRLRADGHRVLYIGETAPQSPDEDVLARAVELGAPLVTTDKDFGELVFRQGLLSAGVILVRLAGLPNDTKANTVSAALRDHATEIVGSFVVISPGLIRIRKPTSE